MVAGKGTIDFKKVIQKDVLYVPDLKANLLSMTQLVIEILDRDLFLTQIHVSYV